LGAIRSRADELGGILHGILLPREPGGRSSIRRPFGERLSARLVAGHLRGLVSTRSTSTRAVSWSTTGMARRRSTRDHAAGRAPRCCGTCAPGGRQW
jgi:hypothetical protein